MHSIEIANLITCPVGTPTAAPLTGPSEGSFVPWIPTWIQAKVALTRARELGMKTGNLQADERPMSWLMQKTFSKVLTVVN